MTPFVGSAIGLLKWIIPVACCYLCLRFLPTWRAKDPLLLDQYRRTGYGVMLTLLGFATVLTIPPSGLLLPSLLLSVSIVVFVAFMRDMRRGVFSSPEPEFSNLPVFGKLHVGLHLICFVLLFFVLGLLVIAEAVNALHITVRG